MTRLGLYGGSFDPIHHGHLRPVARAAEVLDLDRVIYLPTAQPPHKLGRSFAPARDRFAMVELALAGDPRMEVSDFEMTAKPAYTIDTVEHFAALDPSAVVVLLLGADSLARIETWRRWEDLLTSTHLGVLSRPGSSRETALGALNPEVRERLDAKQLTWINNDPEDVSATEIRKRLAGGRQLPGDWLPRAVLDYAHEHCLYS